MFSFPPSAGPLDKVFQYIDLHQDEFVQVGEAAPAHLGYDLGSGEIIICCEMWIFVPDKMIPLPEDACDSSLN